MKKFFSIFRGARREEGMALLFALGFLAMMLILGLGFVTTSLLAQKIAANNSSRAQARMLARSAAARAMLNIMLYNDQAALNGITIENYDSIYSYDQVNYNNHGDGDGDNTTLRTVNDQLRRSSDNATDESKLKYTVGTEDYTGETCLANWLYFYDSPYPANNGDRDGRKIIGRAAFQVLPRQAGRLSLYAVTGGSVKDGDYNQNTHTFRWGRDIAELNLTNTTTLTNWYSGSSVTSTSIPFKYDTLYTSYSSFFTSDNSSVSDMKKRWIEYWFAEGKNPILKDAFPKIDPSNDKKLIYINRFNISDYYYDSADRNNADKDNWYDRFRKTGGRTEGWSGTDDEIAAKKNSQDALEALTQDGVAYRENHSKDSEVNPSGLPFLKRIGNDGWSFKSDSDSVGDAREKLRRQIAANFNDYCDADSIPTSDKTAWSVSDSNKFPTYTGNERTLYINEVAAELGTVKVAYSPANYALQIDNPDDVKFKLWIELINMYDNSNTANSQLLDPANLEAVTGQLKPLAFKYTLSGQYTGKVRYTYMQNNTQKNGEADFTTDVVSADAEINFGGSSTEVSIGNFSPLTTTTGYSAGSSEFATTVTNPDPAVFTNAVNTKAQQAAAASAPSGVPVTVSEIVITSVEVKCQLKTDSKVMLPPVLLRANKDISVGGKVICPKDTGVDFVRFDDSVEMAFAEKPDEVSKTLNTASGFTLNISDTFFIGGIEARDPRQNLNPRYADPEKSDWNLAPRLLGGAKAKSDGIPSLNIEEANLADGTTSYTVNGGKVNTCAKPKEPKWVDNAGTATALAAADIDKETVEDPAWLNDSATGHVSTAYIRNAPMVSPWEIGLIHRGREWQTLNIKRAGGFGSTAEVRIKDIKSRYDDWTGAGTEYANGDGAILEFIKVGESCRCMGKVPLTLLRSSNIGTGDAAVGANEIEGRYHRDIIRMLFDGIRVGQTMKQFYAETGFGAASEQGGTAVTTEAGDITEFVSEVDRLYALTGDNRFRMRSQFLNSCYGDRNDKFTFELARTDNDAQREELIGKTINLLTVNEETPPNVFHVIVVAQSIKDVGGVGADVPITKIHNGTSTSLNCRIGRFDFIGNSNSWENNTYYDEITGEVKALVTIERVPAVDENGQNNRDYGRMVIHSIEFIE